MQSGDAGRGSREGEQGGWTGRKGQGGGDGNGKGDTRRRQREGGDGEGEKKGQEEGAFHRWI